MSYHKLHKIIFIFVVFFAFVSGAQASFWDNESGQINLWTAGAVSVEADLSPWDNNSIALDMQPGLVVSHDLSLDTSLVLGNSDFSYQVQAGVMNSNDLCSRLQVSVHEGGSQIANSLVGELDHTSPVVALASAWVLDYEIIGEGAILHSTCDIFIEIKAFSNSLGYGSGFFDEELIYFSISTDGFDNGPDDDDDDDDDDETKDSFSPGVILNEIAADAIIGNILPLQGKEWVEVYNTSDKVIDIDGWQISEIRGSEPAYYTIRDFSEDSKELYTLNQGTDIAPGEFVVLVFVIGDKLNNKDGDTVTLYLPDGVTVVDQWSYLEATDKTSEGRFPDGSSNWIPTSRTPGAPNELPAIEDSDE